MANVLTGMMRSGGHIGRGMINARNALANPLTGAPNPNLIAMMAGRGSLPAIPATGKALLKAAREQSQYLAALKQINKVSQAARFVASGMARDIDEGMSIANKRESGAERIRRAQHRAGLSKKAREIADRADYYGGSPAAYQQAQADIASERHQKAEEIHKQRRSRDRKAEIAEEKEEKATRKEAIRRAAYDYMDDDAQRIADLQERYKGAPNAGMLVARQYDKEQKEKYLKVLPKMFKESQLSTKTLGKMAKGYEFLGGTGLAKMLKGIGPVGAGALLAKGSMHFVGAMYDREMKADKSIVNLENARGMYGTLRNKRGAMSGVGLLALASGLDETSATKSWGKLNAEWGGQGMMALQAFKAAAEGAPDWAKPLIAQQFGLDENMVSMADNLGKSFNQLSPERRTLVAAEMAQRSRDQMASSGAGVMDRLWAMATDTSYGRAMATIGAMENLSSYKALTNAAMSADAYQQNHAITEGGGSTTNYGGATITIGTMKVEGGSAKDMVGDIMDRANVSDGQREGILKNFDEGQ